MSNDVNFDNLSLGHEGLHGQIGVDGSLSVYNSRGQRTVYVHAQGLQVSGTPSTERVSLNCPLTVSDFVTISNSVSIGGSLTVGADASTGEGGVRLTDDHGGGLELGNSRGCNTTPYIDFHFGVGAAQDYNMRIINSGNELLSVRGGSLQVIGSIQAANSDLYFTKTDHHHTAFGNFDQHPGYAAIENAEDYGALMILGRSTPNGRIVKLWDYLQVCGNLEVTGDIVLPNADCAEDFEVASADAIDAGTVMVIDRSGTLRASECAYDKRVAGVISGAGGLKPGIILDKQQGKDQRLPLALVGKVYCKADAQFGPIEVGDLLTTSPTLGHAMKASDPAKAFGAVIGKALQPLAAGRGPIPIIVALQ